VFGGEREQEDAHYRYGMNVQFEIPLCTLSLSLRVAAVAGKATLCKATLYQAQQHP
jgi:hypothetical protein